MNELQACEVFIRNTLRAHAPLAALVATRTYASLAPQDGALPYVLWNYQGGPDRNAVGRTARLFSRPLYLVKAITEGASYAPADAIAAALDDALLGSLGTLALAGITYRVDCAGREMPVRYLEVPDGKRYCHVGGLYRFFIQRL